MKNIIEAKAALCGARCRSQVMHVVEAVCDSCRFSYSDDLSLRDNAIMAARQSKPKVSNILEFAAQQLERL